VPLVDVERQQGPRRRPPLPQRRPRRPRSLGTGEQQGRGHGDWGCSGGSRTRARTGLAAVVASTNSVQRRAQLREVTR
jgi:hypothetical protein